MVLDGCGDVGLLRLVFSRRLNIFLSLLMKFHGSLALGGDRGRFALQVFRRKAVPRRGSRWFEEPGMFVTVGASELRRDL